MINLEEIQALLEKEHFPAHVLVEDEEHPFQRLVVHLGHDLQSREKMVTLTLVDQLLGSPEMMLEHQVVVIQYLFPFRTAPSAGADTARLVAMLNIGLDLPALQVNEIDEEVTYRTTLLTNSKTMDTPLLVSLLGTVMRTVDLYSDTLEKVALGKQTFLEFVDENLKMMETMQQ